MKKIVLVSNTSWYLYNFRSELIKSLQSNNSHVITIAPRDKYSNKLIESGCEYHDIFIENEGTNPFNDLKTFIQFIHLYKKLQPHAVCHYTIKPNIYGTLAAALLKIPTINNIAGLGTLFIKASYYTVIAKLLYKFSQKFASTVFFQNGEDYNLFVEKYKLVDPEISDKIPGSGVNIDKFKPYKKKKRNKFIFLLTSRMIWDKGIEELVQAGQILRRKYPDIEVQLAGFMDVKNATAITKEQMDRMVNDNSVNYLGETDNIIKYIKNADCCVLPSYREGVPRSLLEAAAMAKPIITTDTPGCRDVVDDGINGFLCKPKDIHDLAGKMERMYKLTQTERNRMGEKGREKIEREFDEKIVINKYLETINGILAD